jgi:hypothetical protein
MNSSIARGVGTALVVIAALAATGAALAQGPPQPPPPQPVVVVGNAQFARVFEDLVLMPGERAERDLEVMGFERVGYLAAATAAAASGRIAVVTAYGPPPVPVENRLMLGFQGTTEARANAVQPVMGPRLRVAVANLTAQKVTLNLSVYAAK